MVAVGRASQNDRDAVADATYENVCARLKKDDALIAVRADRLVRRANGDLAFKSNWHQLSPGSKDQTETVVALPLERTNTFARSVTPKS